jgi:hypothetical protein
MKFKILSILNGFENDSDYETAITMVFYTCETCKIQFSINDVIGELTLSYEVRHTSEHQFDEGDRVEGNLFSVGMKTNTDSHRRSFRYHSNFESKALEKLFYDDTFTRKVMDSNAGDEFELDSICAKSICDELAVHQSTQSDLIEIVDVELSLKLILLRIKLGLVGDEEAVIDELTELSIRYEAAVQKALRFEHSNVNRLIDRIKDVSNSILNDISNIDYCNYSLSEMFECW